MDAGVYSGGVTQAQADQLALASRKYVVDNSNLQVSMTPYFRLRFQSVQCPVSGLVHLS